MIDSREYSVIIHDAEEGGYWVEVPALSGCYSQGESVDDALENVKDAIALYLDVLAYEEADIPVDSDVVFQVSIPAGG